MDTHDRAASSLIRSGPITSRAKHMQTQPQQKKHHFRSEDTAA